MKINFKWLFVCLFLIVVLNLAQSLMRYCFDFYSGDGFVSFLIGGWIGFLLAPMGTKIFEEED